VSIERILVAVDGSANSLAAVGWAASLAGTAGAEVVAVHALGLLEHVDRDEVRQRLESEWCAPLEQAGVGYHCLLQDGPPVDVVLSVAEAEHVDLIVLGCRGLGGYPEQLLGSTSTQVAQRSSRPVTIVPCP
jgi:nucleotide-binding universal stress UspA family protein